MSSTSLRVLFFVSEYHRFHGGQRSLLTLVRHLPAVGVEPIVAFPGEGRCTEAYASAGVRVEIVPAPAALHEFGQHLLHMPSWRRMQVFSSCILPYSFRIVRVMKRLDARILHCNTTRSLLFAGVAASFRRYPVVWHVRGFLDAFSPPLQFACQLLASRIILVAEALRTKMHPWFWHKCRTIYNAIDEESVLSRHDDAITLPTGYQPGQPIVATMAAVTPSKGYHHLLMAARLINQHFAERRPAFLIIGELFDKQYVDYLKSLIHRYEIDNVHFLGWKQNPFPYYRLADVIVLPAVEREQLDTGATVIDIRSGDGLPRTVLEAMYFAKPLVATTVAGTPEQILDGETGLLVPPAEPEALARAIIRLLEAPQAVRQDAGQKAATRVREQFSTERMVRNIAALYQELTGSIS